MKTRNEIIEVHKFKYLNSTKKEKKLIIDIICESTGLSRDRTTRLLNGSSKRIGKSKNKESRGRKVFYDSTLIFNLEKIWILTDFSCGKRLKESLPQMIDALERHNELILESSVKNKLLTMSASTIDRLLKHSKQRFSVNGKSTTKPGTLLKKDIKLRLGSEWDDAVPGYVEIDLVAHCGETVLGSYLNTLDVTDICTGWTETIAVLTKAERYVFNGLMEIESKAPFNYLGIDSDNGSEFINNHLYRYCLKNEICFTRSRPYKKNDGCHVEQKNWQIIRRNIGYERYEGQLALDIMNNYYSLLRLYTNFFLTQTKLIKKIRVGSKIIKKYEIPKTPYQRILESNHIPDIKKEELKKIFFSLNPAALNREMEHLLKQLKNISIPSSLGFEQRFSPKNFSLMFTENQ